MDTTTILAFLYFSNHYNNDDLQAIFDGCDNPALVRSLFDKHTYCKDGYLRDYGFIRWFEAISSTSQRVVTKYISKKIW
tara:strand:+ start:5255 stop:5491 length:237 start_codon:yes stop_codon:yes gene_type:complete